MTDTQRADADTIDRKALLAQVRSIAQQVITIVELLEESFDHDRQPEA